MQKAAIIDLNRVLVETILLKLFKKNVKKGVSCYS